MTNTTTDTIIIGAGLSGLTAALELSHAGRSVTVLDKGRGVGGRLATRRIGDATIDHGAQFFTVRGDEFREVITAAQSDGVVDIWCHGFDGDDGYPRFYCPAGMTALAKWLADSIREAGGTITTAERASAIEATDIGWRVSLESGIPVVSSNLIATPPVPQTFELLRSGGVVLDASVTNALEAIAYKPTLALLVTLDGPSAVLPPGGIQRTEDDLFTFIADNHHKGVSATSALTFHVNGSVSTKHWDDNPVILIAELLKEAAPWIGDAPIVDVELKKWKYAGPYTPHQERCVVARTEPGRLVLAGDAFGGPKVEGAFNSGRAAAAAIGS